MIKNLEGMVAEARTDQNKQTAAAAAAVAGQGSCRSERRFARRAPDGTKRIPG